MPKKQTITEDEPDLFINETNPPWRRDNTKKISIYENFLRKKYSDINTEVRYKRENTQATLNDISYIDKMVERGINQYILDNAMLNQIKPFHHKLKQKEELKEELEKKLIEGKERGLEMLNKMELDNQELESLRRQNEENTKTRSSRWITRLLEERNNNQTEKIVQPRMGLRKPDRLVDVFEIPNNKNEFQEFFFNNKNKFDDNL